MGPSFTVLGGTLLST